jgi:glycosyltransferase involved in cell wall biosynthesis
MRIVTNFPGFPSDWRASDGRRGSAQSARSVVEFLRQRSGPDAVFVIDCDPGLVIGLAAAFLVFPFVRRPLVAVDLVLRRPLGWRSRLTHPVKRFLLARADLYLNYFADVDGLVEVYGIPRERCVFVPFKPNLAEPDDLDPPGTGDYVLCFGRSLRDFDTFFTAIERIPLPAAIARPDRDELRRHGARFSRELDQLPANLRLLDDDGTAKSQIAMLRRAKLVVLPILKTSIVASGISTALNAMLFGRCVIGSAGPGISDIFKDELIVVPPEDPGALADAIDRAWRDDELRTRTAVTAQRYARALGGSAGLAQRVIDQVVAWFGSDAKTSPR